MMNHWYKEAIFYEIYVRAYADGNGDGIGDLPGLISRLDHLRDLGVDCLWLLPISPSPLRDDGYDVADYTSIHPNFGTLDDFKTLLVEAVEFAFDDGTAARGLGPCGAVERGGATALVLPVWVETLVQGA